jgi:hypothetical protein
MEFPYLQKQKNTTRTLMLLQPQRLLAVVLYLLLEHSLVVQNMELKMLD